MFLYVLTTPMVGFRKLHGPLMYCTEGHTNMLQTKSEVSGNFTDRLCIVMQSIVIGIHCKYKGSSANIHHGPVSRVNFWSSSEWHFWNRVVVLREIKIMIIKTYERSNLSWWFLIQSSARPFANLWSLSRLAHKPLGVWQVSLWFVLKCLLSALCCRRLFVPARERVIRSPLLHPRWRTDSRACWW